MKILYINSFYPPDVVGGAEFSVEQIALAVKEKGVDVVVAATVPNEGKMQVEYQNGIKVYRCPIKNVYWPRDKQVHSNISKLIFHSVDSYNVNMGKL